MEKMLNFELSQNYEKCLVAVFLAKKKCPSEPKWCQTCAMQYPRSGFFLNLETPPRGRCGWAGRTPHLPGTAGIFFWIIKEMAGKWILGGIPKSLGGWAGRTPPLLPGVLKRSLPQISCRGSMIVTLPIRHQAGSSAVLPFAALMAAAVGLVLAAVRLLRRCDTFEASASQNAQFRYLHGPFLIGKTRHRQGG